MTSNIYLSGLDRLLGEEFSLIAGKTVGIVTNHTGITKDMRTNFEVLAAHPNVQVGALYAPEHGVRGSIQAGDSVNDEKDPETGIPVYSLYGETKKPTRQMLEGIDVVLYDLQDVGVRYYTYLSTMLHAMEGCAEHGVPILVLDRLNPIGRRVEGNILEPGFESFVGAYPMTLRHGLTVGELALWANDTLGVNADLTVIKCTGWNGQYLDELGLPWVPPSPNIPSFTSAIVYPITCLFEGTNVSEGRGTANPFEYIGAPWINPNLLVEELEKENLAGVLFRPVYFVPTFSKHEGEECGGVQVIVTCRESIDSCLTGLTLYKTIKDLYPKETEWRPPYRERYSIDLLMGTDQIRKGFDSGKEPQEIIKNWASESEKFKQTCSKYLLY